MRGVNQCSGCAPDAAAWVMGRSSSADPNALCQTCHPAIGIMLACRVNKYEPIQGNLENDVVRLG